MADETTTEVSTIAPAPHRTPTPELHAAYTTLEILVALVAVVGNAMVIYVFRRDRRLRRRTNYYIVSLATADFLVGLLGIPFAILASVGLPRNLYACLFTVSLLVMLCTISIFCLVAVSVDRYWAILHPMCYSRNVRTKTAICGFGVRLAPASLMQAPGDLSPANWRQSSADRRAPPVARTMSSFHQYIIIYFALASTLVRAKISGGPHGRFTGSYTPHHHVNVRHAHYSYHPPNHITYLCRHCANPAVYPVYHGPPPSYIYTYRESGSRYGDLLTGLALYNLGRCCGTKYNANVYTPHMKEQCSLQVIDHHHYEETKFPCFLMSSFMEGSNSTHSKLEVLSQTKNETAEEDKSNSFDILTSHVNVRPFLISNESTLEVTRSQECVIWHNLTVNKERHTVPCSLLEQYAETMKPTGVPVYIWMPVLLGTVVTIYIFCFCCCRKKSKKEDAPLNQTAVPGYRSNY